MLLLTRNSPLTDKLSFLVRAGCCFVCENITLGGFSLAKYRAVNAEKKRCPFIRSPTTAEPSGFGPIMHGVVIRCHCSFSTSATSQQRSLFTPWNSEECQRIVTLPNGHTHHHHDHPNAHKKQSKQNGQVSAS